MTQARGRFRDRRRQMAEQFVLLANDPVQWQGAARALRDCAELVFGAHFAAVDALAKGDLSKQVRNHLGTGGVFFFLAGLAIENLVKGLLVQRRVATTTTSALAEELPRHGILDRLKKLEITLSQREAKLARRLEAAVPWPGRYPVPTKAAHMRGTGIFSQRTDCDEFVAFYTRLDELLCAEIRANARSAASDAASHPEKDAP
jgi:hypothetical protein